MRKFLLILSVLVLCVIFGLWSPWAYIKLDLSRLFGVPAKEEISGLKVYSLSGELEVLIDQESFGSVRVKDSPLIIDRIVPGERLIRLKKLSNMGGLYWEYSKVIPFEKGLEVVISYNLGPSQNFSEGHVIYAAKKPEQRIGNELNLKLNVSDFFFQIDNIQPQKVSGQSIITTLSLSSQHKIKVLKNGYEPLEFTILPETQEERDKFRDYDFIIEAELMLQPVKVE